MTDAEIDELLETLHQTALDEDVYELGLPCYGAPLTNLRANVRAWLAKHRPTPALLAPPGS